MQRDKNFLTTTVFSRLKLIGLALLVGSQPSALCRSLPRADSDGHGGSIQWAPCGGNIECGTLSVPLDYATPSAGSTATLSLARYPATNKTARLGTLLTNPGGPGGSGVGFIFDGGELLSSMFDGRYDIVSWDPRGVNGTTPHVECFASETERRLFNINGPDEVVPTTRNLSDPIDYAAYRSQVRTTNSRNKAFARLCEEKSGETLRHVGTATVVRDMELLFRTLEGEEEKVNFWGFSYGTIIGTYFVNMFPDRVGKFVLDGVVDPVIWANNHSMEWLKYFLVDAEKALSNFFHGCADAGPERCALTSQGLTAGDLSASFERLLDELYENPLPVTNTIRPGVLTEGGVRSQVFTYLHRPGSWPELATLLSAVLKGDGGPIFNKLIHKVELEQKSTQSNIAVICSDAPPFDGVADGAVFGHLMDEIVKARDVSPHFGTIGADGCMHWRATATERFTGPFNRSLSNTILVVGNSADPITPLANARAVKGYLGDSARLVVQDGSGHCSLATASLCTTKTVKGYFFNNELPQDGLVCSVDEELFPAPPSNTSPNTLSNRSVKEGMSEDDLDLFRKVTQLGEVVSNHISLFNGPHSF